MIDPASFAGTALAALLAGEHPVLRALARQAGGANIRGVEDSESGTWIDLWVPDDIPPLDVDHRFAIDDVFGRVTGVAGDVGLQLHVVRGRIRTLEAWSDSAGWPTEPLLETTWYVVWDAAEASLVRVEARDEEFAVRGVEGDPAE